MVESHVFLMIMCCCHLFVWKLKFCNLAFTSYITFIFILFLWVYIRKRSCYCFWLQDWVWTNYQKPFFVNQAQNIQAVPENPRQSLGRGSEAKPSERSRHVYITENANFTLNFTFLKMFHSFSVIGTLLMHTKYEKLN